MVNVLFGTIMLQTHLKQTCLSVFHGSTANKAQVGRLGVQKGQLSSFLFAVASFSARNPYCLNQSPLQLKGSVLCITKTQNTRHTCSKPLRAKTTVSWQQQDNYANKTLKTCQYKYNLLNFLSRKKKYKFKIIKMSKISLIQRFFYANLSNYFLLLPNEGIIYRCVIL